MGLDFPPASMERSLEAVESKAVVGAGGEAGNGGKAAAMGIEDLEPTPPWSAARTWDWKVFALAWCAMVANPGSITCGAVLLSLGLSPVEATVSHVIGGLVLMLALQLQAFAGVKYGIPFPVFARASFGTVGAHFCTLSRGAVAIMWLAWQTWQATLGISSAVDVIFGASVSEWGGGEGCKSCLSAFQLLVFLGLTFLHAAIIWVGIERFRILIYIVTPLVIAGFFAIVAWASTLASFHEAMNAEMPDTASLSADDSYSHFLAWLVGITSSVATWSTLVLNVTDLSRFCPTQRDQCVGQALGVPLPFALTGFVGIWTAGATRHAYGVAMWQVPQYFSKFSPLAAGVSAIILTFSLVLVNVLANLISPINDVMNLAPKKFTFRGSGYFCLLLSVFLCPWWIFSDETGFVLTYLNGYAVITGAIAGIMLFDFWLVKRRTLDLQKLYKPQAGCCTGPQTGANWRAFLALAAAVVPCLPGFLNTLPGVELELSVCLKTIYSGSWFFTFFVGGVTYWLLSFKVKHHSNLDLRKPRRSVPRTRQGGASPVSPASPSVALEESSDEEDNERSRGRRAPVEAQPGLLSL